MKKNVLTFLLIGTSIIVNGQSWNLSGNSGVTSSNFVGTLNNIPLKFRVNNNHAGELGGVNGNVSYGHLALPNSTGSYNTAIGISVLNANTTGIGNVGLGFGSLLSNTTGSSNVGIGFAPLSLNTSGIYNIAIGSSSCRYNSTGNYNIGIGHFSSFSNTTGSNNVTIGYNSLYTNSTVSNLVAIGHEALKNSTTGYENTAVGSQSLLTNTVGYRNTAIGNNSLRSNVDGFHNTALGNGAFYSNTTGFSGTAVGNFAMYYNTVGACNTAVGNGALFVNTTGSYNTATGLIALSDNLDGVNNTANGCYSLQNNKAGSGNTGVGSSALSSNENGSFNTAVGYNALYFNNSGMNNSSLGAYTDLTSQSFDNTTAIGALTIVDASNKIRIGNTAVTSIGGEVSWTTFSDARYKKNVQGNVPGLDFITKLKPVTYNIDVDAIDKHYFEVRKKKISSDSMKSWLEEMGKLKHADHSIAAQTTYTGFLAQEVETAASQVNYDFSGVDKPRNDEALYGLRYSEFVPSIVKAIQEQQNTISKLEEANSELSKQNELLSERLVKLEQLLGIQNDKMDIGDNSFRLDQNVPNPFSNETIIPYVINKPGTIALTLYDSNGKLIRVLEKGFKMKGNYSLNIDGSALQHGVYFYKLELNGKELSKKTIKL